MESIGKAKTNFWPKKIVSSNHRITKTKYLLNSHLLFVIIVFWSINSRKKSIKKLDQIDFSSIFISLYIFFCCWSDLKWKFQALKFLFNSFWIMKKNRFSNNHNIEAYIQTCKIIISYYTKQMIIQIRIEKKIIQNHHHHHHTQWII